MNSVPRAKDGLRNRVLIGPLNGRSVQRGRLLITGLGLLVLAGCVSLETVAPTVEMLATADGADRAALVAGRTLYISRCAKCHAVEPVRGYSATQWAEILPDMAERTKLTARETAELQAYVAAVLRQGGG